VRIGTLFALQGEKTVKLAEAKAGDVVAVAKLEGVAAGEWLASGKAPPSLEIAEPVRNFALAIATKDRKDDVRLSTALHKLTEEDRALEWEQDEALHETRLKGVNDEHLKVTLERLKRRYGVAVDSRQPAIGYKESIRKTVTQRGRHKKQSGGHGQFGDTVIEVRPLPRGQGFKFEEKISGGVVPKQWIPAVEAGVRDATMKGPLGFPVVDVAVTLIDGSYHSVDSSEIAFRTAGRIGMSEALAIAQPHLLEPVMKVTVVAPSGATSRATFRDCQPSRPDARHGPARGLVALGPGRGPDPGSGDAGLRRRAALVEPGPCHLHRRVRPSCRIERRAGRQGGAAGIGAGLTLDPPAAIGFPSRNKEGKPTWPSD
jgi:elongation factor G